MTKIEHRAICEALEAAPAAILLHEMRAHAAVVRWRYKIKRGNDIDVGRRHKPCIICGKTLSALPGERIGTGCGCKRKLEKFGRKAYDAVR